METGEITHTVLHVYKLTSNYFLLFTHIEEEKMVTKYLNNGKKIENVVNNPFKDKIEPPEQMDISVFLSLPSVPMQRDTEGRAKNLNVKKMLSVLCPEHLDVVVVELKKTCIYNGIVYKKGWRGILNGNTRAFYWLNGMSDRVPSFVYATIIKCDNMDEVRASYNRYDSPEASESKKQKAYGLLRGLFGFDPTCEKLKRGEFLSALNVSCHFLNPQVYNQSTLPIDLLPVQISEFIEEIKAFDSICKSIKSWDQTLTAAALMSLKKYGLSNPKLLVCLNMINERAMNTTRHKRDGATHISYEWTSNKVFKNKTTKWDGSRENGLRETVCYALYWIEQFMNDKYLSQAGYNWGTTASEWFDYLKTDQNVDANMSGLFNLANSGNDNRPGKSGKLF